MIYSCYFLSFFNKKNFFSVLIYLSFCICLFFFLMCRLISCLIFMTFPSGNMFGFFMSLFIVICSHSFSGKTSQCVCFLWHFVLVLGFFKQLIIIVLCSFDSKQFPEIKRKCCSQIFLDASLRVTCYVVNLGGRYSQETVIETPRTIQRTQNNFSSVFDHFSDFFLCPKVVSFPFKWSQSRAAQHRHVPTDGSTNSSSVHRCDETNGDG